MARVSNPNHSVIYNSYRVLPSIFCKYHPSSKSLFPVFVVIHFLVLTEKIGRCFLMVKIKTLSFSHVSASGHLFALTHQCCDITSDGKLTEPLGSLIYPSDPLQPCLHGCLHLAEPKSSFLLTSLFKFLSHWAAGFSLGTKHRPLEQTLLPICVQQLWQKQLPLFLKVSPDLITHFSFLNPTLPLSKLYLVTLSRL